MVVSRLALIVVAQVPFSGQASVSRAEEDSPKEAAVELIAPGPPYPARTVLDVI